jgi:hypothetical protein
MKLALNTLVLIVTAGASVLLDPAVARAATITYAYTGTVTTVHSPLGGTFAVGDPFTGTFVLDTEATASGCGSVSACVFYLSPLQTYSATVGSYGFSGVGYEVIVDHFNGEDYWEFDSGYNGTTVSGPAVNGLKPIGFYLQLSDPSGAALTGVSLVPPVLSDYSIATFRLVFEDFPPASLSGTIASISVVEPTPPTPPAVPEPASLALLATGLAGLAASRTRRSK